MPKKQQVLEPLEVEELIGDEEEDEEDSEEPLEDDVEDEDETEDEPEEVPIINNEPVPEKHIKKKAPSRNELMSGVVREEYDTLLKKHKELAEEMRKKFIEIFKDNPKKSKELSEVSGFISRGRMDLIVHPLHRLLHESMAFYEQVMEDVEFEKGIDPKENMMRKRYKEFTAILTEFDSKYNDFANAQERVNMGVQMGYYDIKRTFLDYIRSNLHSLMGLPHFVFAKTVVYTGLFVEKEKPEEEKIGMGTGTS